MRMTPRARLTLLPVTLVLATLAADCGGEGRSTPAHIPGVPATATPGGAAATGVRATAAPTITVPPDAPQIDQQNLTFRPATIAARVGETVYFLNSDSALHTVNINGRNVSGNMQKGSVVTWKGDVAGEYVITCAYHFDMRAVVVLE